MRASHLALSVALSIAGATQASAASFEEHTERLAAPQPCFDPTNPSAEGCYSHYVVMADLDGDGDLDIVFANGGGYFVPATPAPLAVYLNDGAGSFRESSGALWGGFEGRVFQVAIADVDADGDLDVYAPDSFGLAKDALFINDGRASPAFTDEAAARLPISSHASAARFGDVNGDGDVDLVVTDWGDHPPATRGTARVYLNDGRGAFAEKPGAVPDDAGAIGAGPVDVDLFDADGDWDLDLLIANRLGSSLFFRGDGAGAFAMDPAFPHQPGPYVYGPDECDVDGDGDLDVWLDNGAKNHTEQLLVNDGSGRFTDETAARVTGNPAGVDDNVVRCADVNGDGALDLVIGSLGGNRRVLVNDGAGRFTLAADAFPAQRISTLGLDVGDVTGDGRLDVVTAQGESGPFLNRLYVGTGAVAIDARAPVVRAIERLADGAPQGMAVVRFAVRDGATSDVGPRLRSATLETADGVVPAAFVGGDLFRAVLRVPNARVTYRACAVDWAGNRGCGEAIAFLPAGAPASVGGYEARGGCDVHGTAPGAFSVAALGAALALFARRARAVRRGGRARSACGSSRTTT